MQMGLHGGVLASTVASQQEGHGFDPFSRGFACSPLCQRGFSMGSSSHSVQRHAAQVN